MNSSRTELALAACAGLSDEELAKRGKGAFAAMIQRKRAYASAARITAGQLEKVSKKLAAQDKQIAELQAKLTAMMAGQLDAPVEDTSMAACVLASIANKTPKTE